MSEITFTFRDVDYHITEENYDPITGHYIVKNLKAPNTTSYPLSGHYYPAELVMTDDNGDTDELDDTTETYGQYLRLRVREITHPEVVLTYPEAPQGKITVGDGSVDLIFEVTDVGGSGLNDSSVLMTFGDNQYNLSSSALIVIPITNGYQIEFEPTVFLSDGEYDVILTASDNDDNVTTLHIIVIADEGLLEFVFDRTISDVNRVKYLRERMEEGTATAVEKNEYRHDMKGARNRSDFVRILTAMKHICNFYEIPFDDSQFALPEIPTLSYIELMLSKISTIRSECTIHNDTPYVPYIPINTYKKMNDIERILFDVWQIIKSRFFYYCDAGLWADGEIGLLE